MLSSLKMRKAGGIKSPAVEVTVPAHFRCPISLDVMKDPVTLCTGITYDRQSIEAWLESGNRTCPVTNQLLRSSEMIPNHAIRKMIQAWSVENQSKGVERIPTPKVPVSAMEAEQMVLGLGGVGRREVVRKMERLCRESERNRRCIAAAGAGLALAEAFAECSELEVQEEVLQVLTMMLPLDAHAKFVLGSNSSVKILVRALQSADLGKRRNSVLMVKELAVSDRARASALSKVEGVVEGLVKVVKEPICPQTTKASLMAMFYLVSSSETETATALVDMGLVPLILEMLMGSDRSISEKALGVLDAICSFDQGREQAANHALTVPVLVKKMFRVSDLATEFAVSALWKLCKGCKGGDGEVMFMECLQVGAFQKVLLLLQVGCGEKTKEKASELLKLMNAHRGRGECIETIDFKQLKRPF